MAKNKTSSAARVYSYIRFSTPEQAMGDSERRQLEAAKAWAERNKTTLDETLDLTDRGLSGFHGHHRTRGKLGLFLAAVERGKIPHGSILLIENVDRLGREGPGKMLREIIFKLWDHGITVQTLSPEETYGPGCDSDTKFVVLILFLQRAWDESQRKSERVRAARDQAREQARQNGRVLTAQCPAWLAVTEDGQFEVVPNAAETLNVIFTVKNQGLGKQAIVKRLNAEASWTPPGKKRKGQLSRGWRESYVAKILTNRAVIGEYQPFTTVDGKRQPIGEPITDYYPAIVKPDLFNAVQEQFRANGHKGGRTGKAKNLFVHLVKCAYCGGPMAFIDKGPLPKGGQYLVCDNARRGLGCGKWSDRGVRYEEVETLVLNNCRRLKPEQVLPNPDEQTKLCESLRQRLAGRTTALADMDRRMSNVTDQLVDEDNKTLRQRLRNKLAEMEQRRPGVEAERVEAERELQKAETGLQSFQNWSKGLEQLRKGIADNVDLRMRLRNHLRELIDRIDVFAIGYTDHVEDAGPKRRAKSGKRQKVSARGWIEAHPDVEDLAETIEAAMSEHNHRWRPDDEFRAFLRHVTERRMSKEGRFMRVWFKTGAHVDLVPAGSLASGMEIRQDGRRKDGWRFVSPSFDKLWEEFKQQGVKP